MDQTDIKVYLVDATSFATRKQLKAWKSMEGHNFLTNGSMQQPCVKVVADSMVIVEKVSRLTLFFILMPFLGQKTVRAPCGLHPNS